MKKAGIKNRPFSSKMKENYKINQVDLVIFTNPQHFCTPLKILG